MTRQGPRSAEQMSLARPGVAGPALELSRVYDENFRYVWRCLKALGLGHPQLDDAVQEVFVVVHRKLPEFHGTEHLRTWLYAIALRIARRARRAAARDAARFVMSDGEPGLAEPGALGSHERGADLRQADLRQADLRQEVEEHERLALARRALRLLDEEKREVFVLMCIEGLTAPEVAGILEVPQNTVYSRLRAARQAFLSAVGELEGSDGATEPAPLAATSNPLPAVHGPSPELDRRPVRNHLRSEG